MLVKLKNFVKSKYDQIYKSIGFERLGLFELIQKEFKINSVLYPGCLIHITPSFYFNHVVYLDKGDVSIEFFSKTNQVSELINKNKFYKESAYWFFIGKDFEDDLELRVNSFDMLLSIFSGKLIKYFDKYIKRGGLILTNSLFSDNESIKNNADFNLLGLIKCRNKKYTIDYDLKTDKIKQSTLRQNNTGFEYVDNEEYYIYVKKK